MIPQVLVILALALIGYVGDAVKIIKEPYQALVERLGRYNRTLKPGVNYVIPFLETIVIKALMSERVLDIPPQQAITKDNVPLTVNAVVYWQILDLRRAYYAIDDVGNALENLTITVLRSKIGKMELQETFSSRDVINQDLLAQLDDATDAWGVKVIRVEVQDIMPAPAIMESMERERAAEIQKRAEILEAEGQAQSIERIATALNMQPSNREFLKYLIAQKYVDGNYKLSESDNSKVVFMDPKAMSDNLLYLFDSVFDESTLRRGNGRSKSLLNKAMTQAEIKSKNEPNGEDGQENPSADN